MVTQYIWVAIAGALFVVGIGIGYAFFASTYAPQQVMLTNRRRVIYLWMHNAAEVRG